MANAKAVRNPTVLPVLQMIDKAQRDGTISTLDLSHIIRGGYVSGGFTSPVDGINHGNDRNMEYVYDPEVKQLLRENIKMMRELACKKLEVSWYGKGGIKRKNGTISQVRTKNIRKMSLRITINNKEVALPDEVEIVIKLKIQCLTNEVKMQLIHLLYQ